MKYLTFLLIPFIVGFLYSRNKNRVEDNKIIDISDISDINKLLQLRREFEQNDDYVNENQVCLKLAQFGYAIGYYRLAEIHGKFFGNCKQAQGLLLHCSNALKNNEQNDINDQEVAFVRYELFKMGLIDKY